MKTSILVIIALCLAVNGYAQTAKVIALSPEDAAKARSLSEKIKMLNDELSELRKAIIVTYLQDKQSITDCSDMPSGCESSTYRFSHSEPASNLKSGKEKAPVGTYSEAGVPSDNGKAIWVDSNGGRFIQLKSGWGLAFEFSDDYKYIVAKPETYITDVPPSCATVQVR